ncbi:nucleotide kinase [Mycobacterium phage CicholasNage]|uniref:Uncharacterized protein n=2 Tax=Bronvirus TaxID=1623278 RepID=A0A411BPE8_9CAUD|nr:nucleotide kinase [Mycobacterium phage CicholasNage]AEK07625.1 hypothetical protein UPIE_92 [Mycobacterium phage UPIE]AEZ50770.1 hypothetical protein [Mycobacterium phage Fezzik]QAY03505.1 hypothetical protein SEA_CICHOLASNAGE_90 [Mycobacterium phage CicholasNage]
MTTRDAVNPSHYKDGWSDGAELISITENLTGNGAQAVQYIARATRLDESKNKSKTAAGLIEDLNKAKWFIEREIRRIQQGVGGPKPKSASDLNITVNPICPPVDVETYFNLLSKHPRVFA